MSIIQVFITHFFRTYAGGGNKNGPGIQVSISTGKTYWEYDIVLAYKKYLVKCVKVGHSKKWVLTSIFIDTIDEWN